MRRRSFGPYSQVLVNEKSRLNLPTDSDRETQVVLPPGSATPGGGGRDIGKFEYNTPDADSDIKPRTLGIPGEQYGHPSNDSYNTVTRRTMTSALISIAAYEEILFEDEELNWEEHGEMEEFAPRRRRKKNKKRRKDKGKKRKPSSKGKNWGKGVKKLKGPAKAKYKKVKRERAQGKRRASVENVVSLYLRGL